MEHLLPSGPTGQKLQDLGSISDLFGPAVTFRIAQTGSTLFAAVSDANVGGTGSSGSTSTYWTLDTTTRSVSELGTPSGYGIGIAAWHGHALTALPGCKGTADPMAACFGEMAEPKFDLQTTDDQDGLVGTSRALVSSGPFAYLTATDGSKTVSLTRLQIDGGTDKNSSASADISMGSSPSGIPDAYGIVTVDADTTAVLGSDGALSIVNWKSGEVTNKSQLASGQIPAALCGGGDSLYSLSLVSSSNPGDRDVQVTHSNDSGEAWTVALTPKDGTGGGQQPVRCAATASGLWVLVSGILFQLDASNGATVQQFELRNDDEYVETNINPQVVASDGAISAFSNNHIFVVR